jgi:hypothetical protein
MTSEVTVEQTDLSVEGLLAMYEAPDTFEIPLPAGGAIVIKSPRTYSDRRKFQKDRAEFVVGLMKAKQSAIKERNDDLIPAPFRHLSNLLDEDNLAAAFTLHRYAVNPTYSPVDALALCRAGGLMDWIEERITYGQAAFLQNLKQQQYEEAGKD